MCVVYTINIAHITEYYKSYCTPRSTYYTMHKNTRSMSVISVATLRK